MNINSGDIILLIIILLGSINYFLLFRTLIEQRSQNPISPPASSWLQYLPAMVGALPLLGLLGTINGILQVFRSMSLSGNTGGNLLPDGIASALLTTQCGLAFAIPAWLLLNYLKQKNSEEA